MWPMSSTTLTRTSSKCLRGLRPFGLSAFGNWSQKAHNGPLSPAVQKPPQHPPEAPMDVQHPRRGLQHDPLATVSTYTVPSGPFGRQSLKASGLSRFPRPRKPLGNRHLGLNTQPRKKTYANRPFWGSLDTLAKEPLELLGPQALGTGRGDIPPNQGREPMRFEPSYGPPLASSLTCTRTYIHEQERAKLPFSVLRKPTI